MVLERQQRIAFARIVSDLMEADYIIDEDELECFENIISTKDLRISMDMLSEAKKISFAKAIEVLQGLPDCDKKTMLDILYDFSLSDGTCVPLEALQLMAVKYAWNGNAKVFSLPSSNGFIENMKVLYIENEDSTKTDSFIRNQFRAISNEFHLAGFDFVFIPQIVDDFKQLNEDYLRKVISYMMPSITNEKVEWIKGELCSMTTSRFSRDILFKTMGINLLGAKPSLLFKIGESPVCNKNRTDYSERNIYSNFLLLELDSNVLATVFELMDTYKSMVSSKIIVETKPDSKKFIYNGFHRSLFDLIAFGKERTDYKLTINLADKSNPVILRPIGSCGDEVALELTPQSYSLYILMIIESISGNGLDWRDRKLEDDTKERLLNKFNRIYQAIGKGNCVSEYKDKTLVSRIKSVLKANEKQVNNIDLFIPKRIADGKESFYHVPVPQDFVYVIENGKECPLIESSLLSSLKK